MGSITLDDRDEAILERLRAEPTSVETLARDVDCDEGYVRDRLPELADNGLVVRTGDGYGLTESGRRATASSPAGTEDDRVDTPGDVERRLAAMDLRADRESAVRAAYAFLRYWGSATAGEIVDAGYSERPAGAASADAWWTDVVRDRLAALPGVTPPGRGDRYWRFDGTPVVDVDGVDGRVGAGGAPPISGSARLAVERLDLSAVERAAVRAAFDHLVRAGEATGDALVDTVFQQEPAGYASADGWLSDLVEPAFEAVPDVERTGNGDRWRHGDVAEGAMSTDPGAAVPDGPLADADVDRILEGPADDEA